VPFSQRARWGVGVRVHTRAVSVVDSYGRGKTVTVENNGYVTIRGIDPTATGESDVFPAHVEYSRGVPLPAFDRATARRVVKWTNRANADASCGDRARWRGDSIRLTKFDDYAPGEDLGRADIFPDEHGRYHINGAGGDWIWETVEKFTTPSNRKVTYWPVQRDGFLWATMRKPGTKFKVTDDGAVVFESPEVPDDVVAEVQAWIQEND
jgi:hypothetical protein